MQSGKTRERKRGEQDERKYRKIGWHETEKGKMSGAGWGGKRGEKADKQAEFVDTSASGRFGSYYNKVRRNCRLDSNAVATFERILIQRGSIVWLKSWREGTLAAGVPGFLSVGQLYQTDWSDRLPIKWKLATCYFPTRFWSVRREGRRRFRLLASYTAFYTRPSHRA